MSNSEQNDVACQATPHEELERRIMDPSIPKNEQEHWAADEIHRLRDILNGGCPMHPHAPDQRSIDDQLVSIVRLANAAGHYDGADLIKKWAEKAIDRFGHPLMEIEFAEVSEPRKCVQAVNRFGHAIDWPTGASCYLHDRKPTNYHVWNQSIEVSCAKSKTGCLHHEPLYIAPLSEPFHSDAVKEAIAESLAARAAGPPFDAGVCDECGAAIIWLEGLPWHAGSASFDRTWHEPGVSALAADAARKLQLADMRERHYVATMSDAKELQAHIATKRQLAAAEKRAKEAEDDVSKTTTAWAEAADERDANASQVAALTRKLVTAREGLERVALEHAGATVNHEEFTCARIAREALAAIDAPAGEEADGIDVLRKQAHDELDKCLDEARMGSHGWLNDYDERYASDRVYSHVHGYAKAVQVQHAAPPPEPANAQGSDAVNVPVPMVLRCPKCGMQHIDVDDETGNWATTRLHRRHLCKPNDGGCGHVWRPFDYATVGVKEVPPPPLSPPPFTSEEARERAARGYLYGEDAKRVVATLRSYADLLERGDALERAAQAVSDAWNITDAEEQHDALVRALRDLNAELAKRPEERP